MSSPESSPITISDAFADIQDVRTKKGHEILHSMKVDFPEGSVCAILGPSGGGKTTFINVVTDNIQSNLKARGIVSLPGSAAFVPQDDQLHGFYTCRSYLKHYARLSGIKVTNAVKKEIDQLLKDLGLYEQADTIVGDIFFKGLSGGQKRRLSVALEALTHPKNFFLDEPTSGLDAESAYQVMEFLKKYVRTSPGRRVILTIHQPNSHIWQLLDHVILLSKGKLIYQGPRMYMENFFCFAGYPTPENFNPADHYVTVINDEFRLHALPVDEWAEKFVLYSDQPLAGLAASNSKVGRSQSMIALRAKDDILTRRSRSPLVIFELVYRYFLNLWFNPGILGTRLAMYSMLALMVGALFFGLGDRTDFESINSRAAVLFYGVAFFVFMSVAVLPFTVMERSIVDKEVRNGYYYPSFYQFAQALSSIPGAALLAGVTTVIVVFMLKLNDPLWYFINMFLALVCAEALAQMVSHVVPHFIIGMALIAGLYGFFMLFMGFMILPSDFPLWLRWTYNVAFHTYSFRSFMYSEFCCEDDVIFEGPFPSGKDVLAYFEIENVNRGEDMAVLAGYAGIIHLLSLIVLHMRYYSFRGKLEKPTRTRRRAKREQAVATTAEAAPEFLTQLPELPNQRVKSLRLREVALEELVVALCFCFVCGGRFQIHIHEISDDVRNLYHQL